MSEQNGLLNEAIIIENEDHILYPGEKKEFVKIEYLDIRKNIYTEGDTLEKSKAMALIQKGLAKLKIIPKSEQPKQIVRCKWISKAMRGRYEGNYCHMEKEKAQRLEAEGHLKIVEGLRY